jgi:opacity protein-like surface antigen
MKKLFLSLLIALPLLAACGEKAEAIDWNHDITVAHGDTSLSWDNDGDKVAVGVGSTSVWHSDSVDIGVGYDMNLNDNLAISAAYEFEADEDSVVSVGTTVSLLGLALVPSVDWNISDSQWSSNVSTSYGIMGATLDASIDIDLDDPSLTGSEYTLGYSMALSESVSVTPSFSVPFDDDWKRGDLTAGLSITASF